MLFLEPIVAILLMALTALFVSGAAVLLVRSRKNRNVKSSRSERKLLHGLGPYTAHADEMAELTASELEPQGPVSKGTEEVSRLRGMVKHRRKKATSIREMEWAVRRRAAQKDSDQ